MQVLCAWCGTSMRGVADEQPVSHGICTPCATTAFDLPVHAIQSLAPELLDRLPFGVIRLDRDGRVTAYNRAESRLSARNLAEVIGQDFFEEIAPCTNVRELAGWVAERRAAAQTDRRRIQFVFAFPDGDVPVRIAVTYHAPTGVTHLLVDHDGA